MTDETLSILARIAKHLDGDVSLGALAERSTWSRFKVQREFSAAFVESPKAYANRVRLEVAAALLVATDRTVLDIAVEQGFNSHEVFARAFQRHFGMNPGPFRGNAKAFFQTHIPALPEAILAQQVAVVSAASPCLTAFHHSTSPTGDKHRIPTMSVTLETLNVQPTLSITRTTTHDGIQSALAEVLPAVFGFAQKHGAVMVGPPSTRYLEFTPGSITLQGGVPVAAHIPVEGDIEATELPGGEAATLIHQGPYDTLTKGYAALEAWVTDNDRKASGPMWEVYLTDPGTTPDPNDWQTKIYMPLA